jgi:hypothetical protein
VTVLRSVASFLGGIAQSTAGFDPFAVARTVMTPGRTIKNMAAEFERMASPAIETELRRWPRQPLDDIRNVNKLDSN